MNKLFELYNKADGVMPIHTDTRPVWDGSKNVYEEIKNMVFANILKKYYNNSSVIWWISECKKLLSYDVGSEEQPDINIVVIRSDIRSDVPQEIHSNSILNAYQILKTAGIITRVKPNHYMVNPSIIVPFISEDYHTVGSVFSSAPQPESLHLLTFCVLVLRNGFTVTGESACVSPETFDAEIGRKIARQKAVEKIWPLMGYALKQKLHDAAE